MNVDQYIRKEVKRQLRLKRLGLGAPPPYDESGRLPLTENHTAESVHLEDKLGMWELQKEIAKLGKEFGLGLGTQRMMLLEAKKYSRFWTMKDLMEVMSRAMVEVDDEKRDQVLARLETWYERKRPKALEDSSFFERVRTSARMLKWWEILLLGLAAGGVGVVLYEIYKQATERKEKQIVRYLGPVRTPIPGRT